MNLNYVLFQGDNLERFEQILDNTVDSIICDPPYGLKFMAKGWDSIGEGADQREWHRAWLAEAYRVLKPNGILKAFSGTRTFHHLAYMVEETGFKNVKIDAWSYGSGFPKSLNLSKAIEKKQSEQAQIFEGYGTALKPAWEPIVTAIKL